MSASIMRSLFRGLSAVRVARSLERLGTRSSCSLLPPLAPIHVPPWNQQSFPVDCRTCFSASVPPQEKTQAAAVPAPVAEVATGPQAAAAAAAAPSPAAGGATGSQAPSVQPAIINLMVPASQGLPHIMYNLKGFAPKLSQHGSSNVLSTLTTSDGEVLPFLDQGCIKEQICSWLNHVHATSKRQGGATPIYISGLIKVGKSFILKRVLPALVAQHHHFGIGCPGELAILLLDLSDLPVSEGLAAMQRHLLRRVVDEMLILGMSSRRLDLAVETLRHPGSVALGEVVCSLLGSLEVGTLVLIDEVQNLLLPRDPATNKLDVPGQKAAALMLKRMLCFSSLHCIIAVTGSSMARFWVELAMAPPNGISPLLHGRRLHLPSTHSKWWLWRLLRLLIKDPVERQLLLRPLLHWAENAAMLTYALDEYRGAGHNGTVQPVHTFLADFTHTKIMAESASEWGVMLEAMSPVERRSFLGLALANEGLELRAVPLYGLQYLLESTTRPITPGSMRRLLSSSYHRAALQLLVDSDGNMRKLSNAHVAHDKHIGYVDAHVHFSIIGNVIKQGLLDSSGKSRAKQTQKQQLLDSLTEVARRLTAKEGPAQGWRDKAWFQRVWFAAENQLIRKHVVRSAGELRSGTAKSYLKAVTATALRPEEHLAWYLVMVRNILCHQGDALNLSSTPLGWQVIAESPLAQPVSVVPDLFQSLLAHVTSTTAPVASGTRGHKHQE